MKRNWLIIGILCLLILIGLLGYIIGWRFGWDACLGLKISTMSTTFQEEQATEYQEPMTDQEAITRISESLKDIFQNVSSIELHIKSEDQTVDIVIKK